MPELSAEARNLNWLITNFVDRVPGVNEAVVVSSDGLPMAVSEGLEGDARSIVRDIVVVLVPPREQRRA